MICKRCSNVYRDVIKPGWQWRALRLLSQKSRHLFEQTQTPARKIPDYLEDIMRKLAKEVAVSGHVGMRNGMRRGLGTHLRLKDK